MKANIAHTTEGRTLVVLKDVSARIETYFSNLGGKKVNGKWIFSRADGKHVPAALKDEGYEYTVGQLI